jgi:hypothetical protein
MNPMAVKAARSTLEGEALFNSARIPHTSAKAGSTMNPFHRMRPVLLLRPPPPLPLRKDAAESSKAMKTETLNIMNYKWAPTAHQ